MPEGFSTKIDRIKFNFFPAYRGSRARVSYVDADYREIRVKIPLTWRTRNYVGKKSADRIYSIKLADKDGKIHAIVEKTLYIAKKGNNK